MLQYREVKNNIPFALNAQNKDIIYSPAYTNQDHNATQCLQQRPAWESHPVSSTLKIHKTIKVTQWDPVLTQDYQQ